MGASYYDGIRASKALDTGICCPVATNPTWNMLDAADRAELKKRKDGGLLWHMLLGELKPQIVTVSVAKAYLEDITFTP